MSPTLVNSRCILSSYPKSGRTWLRFILANYLNEVFQLNLDLDLWNLFTLLPNRGRDPKKGIAVYKYHERKDIPLIVSTHALWKQKFGGLPIIFLIRSPSDILVSYFCHLSYSMGVYDGNLQEFIRDPQRGINALIVYLNNWSTNLDPIKTHLISYEQMQDNPQETIGKVIEFMGLLLDEKILNNALEAASFSKMRDLETTKGAPWLRVEVDNPESFRTRRGVTGGRANYLQEEDLIYIKQQCELKFTRATRSLLAKAEVEKYN